MIRSSSQELTRAFKQPLHARRFQVNLYDPHSQVAQEPPPGQQLLGNTTAVFTKYREDIVSTYGFATDCWRAEEISS